MNAEQANKHIDDQCGALVAKRKLLLTVEVRTPEEAEELLRWMYSDHKPMKASLLEIAWNKSAVPTAVADAAATLIRAGGG